jgi:hypothetical protein
MMMTVDETYVHRLCLARRIIDLNDCGIVMPRYVGKPDGTGL